MEILQQKGRVMLTALFSRMLRSNKSSITDPIETLKKEGYIILHRSVWMIVVVGEGIAERNPDVKKLNIKDLSSGLDKLGLIANTRRYMSSEVVFIEECEHG